LVSDLVQRVCSNNDVDATDHLKPERRKTKACDGDNDSFYHSLQDTANPFLTLKLHSNHRIKKITVVNVHTGDYCKGHPKECTERLHGALVGVLTGRQGKIS
jgi:hypothetical protein